MREDMADFVETTFRTAQFLPNWADLPRLQQAFAEYRTRPGRIHHQTFFRYLMLELWARQFLTGKPTALPARADAANSPCESTPLLHNRSIEAHVD
jgi:hypothetical protein